jgi:hypothetical protein
MVTFALDCGFRQSSANEYRRHAKMLVASGRFPAFNVQRLGLQLAQHFAGAATHWINRAMEENAIKMAPTFDSLRTAPR